jgi:lipoprotein-releasing system ATP-binding protein
MNNPSPLVLSGLSKAYPQGNGRLLRVLRGVDFELSPGKVTALLGISGTGKSTLLHIAGLLEKPDDGDVMILGQSTRRLSTTQSTVLRRSHIGFVFQFHNLLPEFTVLENVMLPQQINGASTIEAKIRAMDLLGRLLLQDHTHKMPQQLSGGQQQRVAIARALANRPKVLLADEPTGNLDPTNAMLVFQMLLAAAHEEGTAALIATHNDHLSSGSDRVVRLENGTISDVERPL